MPQPAATPVTVDNFVRAETDMYFAGSVKDGGIGKIFHHREPVPIDKQSVVRSNRDTLYSSMVIDLDAGPVTITLPDAEGRFMSMQVINEDHYVVAVEYDAGRYTYSRDKVGTRYLLPLVRTLVDPSDPKDIDQVHALQDAIKLEQKALGAFETPSWDPSSQKAVRDALGRLGTTLPDSKATFGAKDEVDPVRHLIGTAVGWGGNPERDAFYVGVTPPKNDGATVYQLHVADVPVDGFWSVSVYNAEGFFEPNPQAAYSLNNITATKNDDGSVDIQFGGCGGNVANCLPIVAGWNYTVRLYRPRPEFLSGEWTFPEAEPV
jgi:hypothetical protein